jgi:hypothetical protein
MKINRNNYALFFIDYLDGNLSDLDILMLEDFLLINPDLRAELEGTEKIMLNPEPVIFDRKDLLIKPDLSLPVNVNNYEDFCVAAAEGDLDIEKLKGLNEYNKQNPGSEKILALFRKLHLAPDSPIVFQGKEKLKKGLLVFPRKVLFPVLSVAAAIAIIFIIYLQQESHSENISAIASGLPVTVSDSPKNENNDLNADQPIIRKQEKYQEQASIIAFSYPKAKKKSPVVKARESFEKKNTDNKKKEALPTQRLNPSFQIKLPSVADNSTGRGTIVTEKIRYNTIISNGSTPDYLSLSEYARKQLSEKVLGTIIPADSHISAWQLADAGITGLNKLTGGQMKLEKTTGHDGHVTSYSFNSRLLSFSTTAVR